MSIFEPSRIYRLANGERMLPTNRKAGRIVLLHWVESILGGHGKLNLHGITSLRGISGQFI